MKKNIIFVSVIIIGCGNSIDGFGPIKFGMSRSEISNGCTDNPIENVIDNLQSTLFQTQEDKFPVDCSYVDKEGIKNDLKVFTTNGIVDRINYIIGESFDNYENIINQYPTYENFTYQEKLNITNQLHTKNVEKLNEFFSGVVKDMENRHKITKPLTTLDEEEYVVFDNQIIAISSVKFKSYKIEVVYCTPVECTNYINNRFGK